MRKSFMENGAHSFTLIMVVLFAFVGTLYAAANETPPNTDTVFYIGESKHGDGAEFIQPSSEFENIIFVSHTDLAAWGFDSQPSTGTEFIATFTGSDLWEIKKIEYAE